MSDFKGRHFRGEIVLWAVRWYCRYPISYRDLEAMMTERGVAVDHSTIYRWVQRFAAGDGETSALAVAPAAVAELARRRDLHQGPRQVGVSVPAVDKLGNTIDFYLSATRNTKAAKRFLGKALRGLKEWEQPEVLNTDKAPAYAAAIAELKAEGKCPKDTRHRQVKYLNNVIEADHGKLKLLIRARARVQDDEDGLRHDQGLRGDARAAQGPGRDVRPPGRHCRRGPDRRARLRSRTVRSDRGDGMATGPSGQRRIIR